MPFPVISKGVLLKENLSIISRDEKWLNNKLKEKGYNDSVKYCFLWQTIKK